MKKLNGIKNLDVKKAVLPVLTVGVITLTGCGNQQFF